MNPAEYRLENITVYKAISIIRISNPILEFKQQILKVVHDALGNPEEKNKFALSLYGDSYNLFGRESYFISYADDGQHSDQDIETVSNKLNLLCKV